MGRCRQDQRGSSGLSAHVHVTPDTSRDFRLVSRDVCMSECGAFHILMHTSSGPVHTTPEEFENVTLTLKAHQMFSVHTKPEQFKT